MKRKERKTISEMIAAQKEQQELNEEAIETATEKIHGEGSPAKVVSPQTPQIKPQDEEYKPKRTVRTSVDIPAKLHPKLKKIVIDLDTDLKSFFLDAGLEKLERLGYKIETE